MDSYKFSFFVLWYIAFFFHASTTEIKVRPTFPSSWDSEKINYTIRVYTVFEVLLVILAALAIAFVFDTDWGNTFLASMFIWVPICQFFGIQTYLMTFMNIV